MHTEGAQDNTILLSLATLKEQFKKQRFDTVHVLVVSRAHAKFGNNNNNKRIPINVT